MTNNELQLFLQRFPPDAQVEVKLPAAEVEIKAVQLAFNADPMVLQVQNVGWADMVKERIKVQLVTGTPGEKAKDK
jgi:hypothetical protein